MDVTRLFKKIQNLEVAILFLMNESEKNCLTLSEPPSKEKVKKNRLIADYYNAVIEGKPAMTVEDVKIVKGVLQVGLSLASIEIHEEETFSNDYHKNEKDRSGIL